MLRKTKRAFTLAEVLVSLFLICLIVVSVSQMLSSTAKVSKSKDIGVRVLTQNINTVEYFKDAVKSKNDLWKLYERYDTNIDKYHAVTTCEVLAVGEGKIENFNNLALSADSSGYKVVESIRSGTRNFGKGYMLKDAGDKVAIDSAEFGDSYNELNLCLVGPEDTDSIVKVTYDGLYTNHVFRGELYLTFDTRDAEDLIIQNMQNCASGKEIYVANSYLTVNGATMGYDETNTISEDLVNKSGRYPTLYKVTIKTDVDKNGLTEVDDEVLKKISEDKKKMVTYIHLKE